MEFIKHNFKVGDRVTVEQLNEIEDGIIEAAQSGGSAEAAIDEILDGATQLTTFKDVEDNITSIEQDVDDVAQDVSQQGEQIFTIVQNVGSLTTQVGNLNTQVGNLNTEVERVTDDLSYCQQDLETVQDNMNSLAEAIPQLIEETTGPLTTKVNVHDTVISQVLDELGMTIDDDTQFPGASGKTRLDSLEESIVKVETNRAIINTIVDELGLNSLLSIEYPTENAHTTIVDKLQLHDDLLNILNAELGLDAAVEEEYPTDNELALIDKINYIIVDLDNLGGVQVDLIKLADPACKVRCVGDGFVYRDIISLAAGIPPEGDQVYIKYIGKLIDGTTINFNSDGSVSLAE